MAKDSGERIHKFVPWHGVLYTTIGTQISHGFLSSINSTIYRLKHGNDFDELESVSNYGLQPYVRTTSMASTSTINFGTPFGF